jgi:hypothetical protein
MNTITNFNEIIKDDPDKFIELQSRLSKLEGMFRNLKGDMFEFVVAYYYSLHGKTPVVGKIINDMYSMKSKEIDVYIDSPNEIKIIECKGHKSPISYDYIKREWLGDKIPTIRKWVLNRDDLKTKKLVFEIWSTSGFDDESKKLLEIESKKVKPTKYKIEFFDWNKIREKARDTNDKKFKQTIEKYYK